MAYYTLKTWKAWNSTDLEDAWSNSYEFQSSLIPAEANFQELVDQVISAERAIHLPFINFIQATVSTYERESEVYDPFSFVTYPLEGVGLRVTGGADPMADNVCLYVRRKVASGRNGKLFYRGVLHEADVTASAKGRFRLVGGALGPGTAEYQAYMLNMQNFLGGGEEGKMQLIGEDDKGQLQVRNVLALVPAGVKLNKRNHKFFNRKPKTPPTTPAAV